MFINSCGEEQLRGWHKTGSVWNL